MSLIKVNSVVHPSSTANNITLDNAGNVTIGNDLNFTSTTLASPAVAGSMEYNGTSLYFTPLGTQRGFVPGMQFYSHAATTIAGANSTANQSILGVGFSVTAGTLYQFQGRFNFFKSAGATSHTMSYSWGGTATFLGNRILTNMLVQSSTQGFTPYNTARTVYSIVQEVANSTVVTSALASSFTTINLQVDGMFIANTSGTVIPQYSLSAAPGGGYTHSIGNYLAVWPVSAANSSASNVSIGTWA